MGKNCCISCYNGMNHIKETYYVVTVMIYKGNIKHKYQLAKNMCVNVSKGKLLGWSGESWWTCLTMMMMKMMWREKNPSYVIRKSCSEQITRPETCKKLMTHRDKCHIYYNSLKRMLQYIQKVALSTCCSKIFEWMAF